MCRKGNLVKNFKLHSLFVVIGLLAMLGLLTPANVARAQSNSYAVLCIENNTGMQINYLYRWGNRSWQSSRLDADEYDVHSWKYTSGSTVSPDFQIKFDADLTSGVYYQIYDLERYQAPQRDCAWGKIYSFEEAGYQELDLYAND